MCVRVSNFGDARPWALGVKRFSFGPGYAAAWSMRRRSVSSPLFSALASAPSITMRIFAAAFMGYLPEKDFTSPCLCPTFLFYRVSGTGFFLSITSLRYCLAFLSVMPLTALHTSRACLRDTLISRPEAFAVFSGSNASVRIEYPHFGMFYFSVRAMEQRKSDLYGFP